jgi:hypothetical protein
LQLLRPADVWLIHNAVNIPAIAVFTKYDMLVNEHYQAALKDKVPESEIDLISEKKAEISFNSQIEVFRSLANVPCLKVSTDDDYPGWSPCFSPSSLEISSSMQRLSD